jgi:hypothetical protein
LAGLLSYQSSGGVSPAGSDIGDATRNGHRPSHRAAPALSERGIVIDQMLAATNYRLLRADEAVFERKSDQISENATQ